MLGEQVYCLAMNLCQSRTVPPDRRDWTKNAPVAWTVTVFFSARRFGLHSLGFKKIDRTSAIVAETEQIPNRGNSSLSSRAQISDGSGSRFFFVRGKIFIC